MKDAILLLVCILFLTIASYYARMCDEKNSRLHYHIEKTGETYSITVTDNNGYVGKYEDETITEVNQIINQ